MSAPLAVLIVDDSQDATALFFGELRRHGFAPTGERVGTPQAMAAALERQAWDLILSDSQLQDFSGLEALKLVQDRGLDIPFIFVSEPVGDEAAVQGLKAGAHDFVSKRNVARLGSAVSHELQEAASRRERQAAEASLRRSEATQRFLARVTALLGASLDYEHTLASLARALVSELATGCVVELREGGAPTCTVVAHTDSEKEDFLRELEAQCPGALSNWLGAEDTMFNRSSTLHQPIPDEVLQRSARNDDQGRLLRGVGIHSALVVPVTARGRVFGVMTLLDPGRGPKYQHEDLALAREIGNRAGTSVDNALMFERAQSAIASRDEFLSLASHELRTPLSSLVLQLGSLRREVEQDRIAVMDTRIVTKIDRAKHAADRLTALVTDLLEVSRIITKKLRLHVEEVELTEVANEVVSQFREQASRVGCELRLHSGGPAWGFWDRERIAQVLSSLISNALKYAPENPVDIWIEPRNDMVHVTVRDYGPGISPQQAQRVFDRFERAVPVQHYGGLGLGLYVAQRIVAAHGGRLEVRSQPGEGAAFIVSLLRTDPEP
jgi:signal transduction histidine kinase/DNA-binding response OmpR family regulator